VYHQPSLGDSYIGGFGPRPDDGINRALVPHIRADVDMLDDQELHHGLARHDKE
jgi:hypothetical protein